MRLERIFTQTHITENYTVENVYKKKKKLEECMNSKQSSELTECR